MNARTTTRKRDTATATEERRAQLRRALDLYLFLEDHSEVLPEEMRSLARELGVPHLLLLIAFYENCSPAMVQLDDLDEFTAEPAAREVLAEWMAELRKAVA